jgi:hypothetical protein
MHLLRSLTVALSAVAAVSLTPLPAQAIVNDRPAPSASFNGTVRAVATYGTTTFVAGDFTRATDSRGTFVRRHLAAVDNRTGRLLRWHPRTNGAVYAIAAYRGRVYIGGAFTEVNGVRRARVAKLTVRNGARDRRFRAVTNAPVRALAVTRTRLYLGGDFTRSAGARRLRLAAYDRGTNRLTRWHPRANGPVLALQATRRLVFAGGSFTTVNGNPDAFHVAAIRAGSGRVSGAFQVTGVRPVTALKVTGTRVYVGAAGVGGHLYVYTRAGVPLWHKTFDGDVDAIGTLDGVVYVGGHWAYLCRTDRVAPGNGDCAVDQALVPRLAAFSTSGRRLAWGPQANSPLGVLAISTSTATSTVSVGGGFTTFKNGTIQQPAFALFG